MEIDVTKIPSQPALKVDKIFVTVFLGESLEKSGFKGFAKSVSSFDTQGPFDVLPNHENFVTKFSKSLEIVPLEGEKIKYRDQEGIIEVANNVVRIFTEKKEGVSANENR